MAGKKSVIKTVKQLLPRKFDLSLVVAVILAGLLVCYLFKDVRISKVEGFTAASCDGQVNDSTKSGACVAITNDQGTCEGTPGCVFTSTGDSGQGTCALVTSCDDLEEGECGGDDGVVGCTWQPEDSSCTDASVCPPGRQFCVSGECSATGPSDTGIDTGDGSSTLDWTSAATAFQTAGEATFQTEAKCMPIVGAGPEVNCDDLDEDECGPGSSGSAISQTNCRWSDCSEVYSMTGTLEGGYFQTWMDECLFDTDFGTVEQTALDAGPPNSDWLDTSTIPLAPQGDGSASLSGELTNDFLAVMGLADPGVPTDTDAKATVNTILTNVQESNKIPDNYKTVVHKKVKQCADGWLQNSSTKDAYKDRAGGRPIMGYNSKDGLKCRNSFYQTTETPTSESRLIFDSDICDECPCEPPSHCGWAEAVSDDGVISRTIDGISHSVGGNRSWCRVPACRSMYSASWCGPSAIYDTFADVGATAMDSLPNLGGSAGKCSS